MSATVKKLPQTDSLIGEFRWARLNRLLLQSLDDEQDVLAELEREYASADAGLPGADSATAPKTEYQAVIASLAAQIVVSSFGNMRPLQLWVPRILPFVLSEPQEPMTRLQLASGLLCAFDHGGASELSRLHAERVARMGREASVELRSFRFLNLVIAANEQIPAHYSNTGDVVLAGVSIDEQERLASSPAIDERLAARALYWAGASLRMLDEIERSKSFYSRAAVAAEKTQWHWLQFQQTAMNGRGAFDQRDVAGAQRVIDALKPLLNETRPFDVREFHHLSGWLATIEGKHRQSEQHYRIALEAFVRADAPPASLFICRSAISHAMVAQGKLQEGLEELDNPPPLNKRIASASEAARAFIRAMIALKACDYATYEAQLKDGFARAREFEMVRVFMNLPSELAQLCAAALQRDIETEFVKKLINWRKLPAPAFADDSWPWVAKVHTLGGFSLAVNDSRVEGVRKSNDLRIELLKLLATHDAKPVAISTAISLLWPEADAINGRKSFDMVLSRLRKLLGHDDAILVDEGKLVINKALVWFDTAGLTTLTEQNVTQMQPAELNWHAGLILKRYPQTFLRGEDAELPWLQEARERYKHRFVRAATLVSNALVERQMGDAAVALIEKALDAEPLAESLYRKLMQIHADAKNAAEGLRVYRRCREMLSIMLAVKPSAETETLANVLAQLGASQQSA